MYHVLDSPKSLCLALAQSLHALIRYSPGIPDGLVELICNSSFLVNVL